MVIGLKLLKSQGLKKNGYPLYLEISHKKKRRRYKVCDCLPEHWLESEQMISVKHPEYDIISPQLMLWKNKARQLLVGRPEDIDAIYAVLFSPGAAVLGTFYEMGMAYVADLEAAGNAYEKQKNHIKANKAQGNARVYHRALLEFNVFAPGVRMDEINFRLLWRFREARLAKGNSKSTVSLYLRTLRALYNHFVKIHDLEQNKPFEGVMQGLTVKSYATRKKNASMATVRQIERIVHDYESLYRFTDFWLLQFYLGGADYMDVYYLKNAQLRNGRVYFERNKGNGGGYVDLKIHPKAQAVIDKYRVADSEYVFPWRKDVDGYRTHRRKAYEALKKAQLKHGIELNGEGGRWGHKVARHTFASIGKTLGIDEDLLRELQGHERDDVDNYYKERFSQEVRDEALFKIIG